MNLGFQTSVLFALLFAACGCTSLRVERERPEPIRAVLEVDMTAVTESLLEWRGAELGTLDGEWKGNRFFAETALKGEEGRFTCVLMTPAMRLFTITLLPPHAIVYERCRRIPALFRPERAVFDLALIHLDRERLAAALGPGFTVEEKDGTRRILAGGRTVAETVRTGENVKLTNVLLGYSYTISRVSAE